MEISKKILGLLTSLSFCSIILITGCSKDKNLDDLHREELQENISRIESISGSYTGPVISKLDGSSLGEMNLNFQARTDIESRSGQVSSEQNSTLSGSLSFRGIGAAEVVFDNGFYDDQTGNFQVTIPVTFEGGTTSKLSLSGQIVKNTWVGTIEVKGQPKYGAQLNLVKNAPQSNTPAIEVGGTRLEQIKRMSLVYAGLYNYEGKPYNVTMSFINKDISPDQAFFKLFSPVRIVNLNFDLSFIKFNFPVAILDDKTGAGTIVGDEPMTDSGDKYRANLNCEKFDEGNDNFGWNCQLQTKVKVLNLHLTAIK